MVYSMKQLRNKNVATDHYCHLIRAISLKKKKLLFDARKEFLLIPRDFKFYSVVVTNLGEIALEENRFQEALRFFTTAERDQSGNAFKGSSLYHDIGLCYFHLDQFDKAEAYLVKGLQIQQKDRDTLLLIGSYMDMANLYYAQYKDAQAISFFEKAYELSKKTPHFELKQNAAFNMAVVAENNKNLTKALAYRKEYETWKDSLNDQNKVWAIAETEKKYLMGQKQKEIRLLEARNKMREAQRDLLFYSSLLLLVLFGTGVYFYRQKIKSNATILSQKIALDELNATKDRLFSIVSHDLRSSVNALKTSNSKLQESLGSKNYDQLNEQLHNNSRIASGTYTLLDNLLHWAMLQTKQSYFHQEWHPLSMLIAQVSQTCMPLIIDKRIVFENNVPDTVRVFVDLDSIKIVFRNLLDNAIKFSSAEDTISVYIAGIYDGFCQLVFEDTGEGMNRQTRDALLNETFTIAKNNDTNHSGAGLGMQLCKSSVLKNGGRLSVESEVNVGTKIILSLQVNQ